MKKTVIKLLGVLLLGLFVCNTSFSKDCDNKKDVSQWNNCFGRIDYSDGEKYFGEYKHGKRYGQGTYIYHNGDKYVGEWHNGNKHGYGILEWANGDKYEGNWILNRMNGHGILTFANGDKYVGDWKNSKRHGVGKYSMTTGQIYDGIWENGRYSLAETIIKDTGDLDDLDWLRQILDPGGKYVFKKDEEKITTRSKITTEEKYYALVIGNNNYEHLEKLDAAENDAKVIADVLKNNYGFEVKLLLNANYDTTVDSIHAISKKLTKNDNLLIFYAGHGELDKKQNRGYWLPVDASYEKRSKWVSNAIVADELKATDAKHVLLIVDSCFSGSLMRSATQTSSYKKLVDVKYIKKLQKKKTRLVITSGGNEPVMDNDGGDHSLFAQKLINTLKENKGVINTELLFKNIRQYVSKNSDQMPEKGAIYKAGHDGGDFLFFAKN